MSILLDRFADYGVDPQEVMERFVNDEELYAACLEEFMHDPAFEKLKEALDADDYSAAFDQAHTLKGVAGNLGLKPLYLVICEIVEPLRTSQHQNYEELYQKVLKEKDRVGQILKEL
ncbi:MAG: Hpt domain-containing protein [Lachnospiraceae bacterium]|nr:Hpt domain-containing protein [Lachnospiraceae bacterium]